MLKRDRAIVSTALVGVVVIAWIYLVILAAKMNQMSAMDMMEMTRWSPVDFVLLAIMWSVIMIGMMVPSATPAILNFARLSREKREQGVTYVPTAVFLLGYLAVWTVFSLGATVLQWLLNSLALLSPMMVTTGPDLGGSSS